MSALGWVLVVGIIAACLLAAWFVGPWLERRRGTNTIQVSDASLIAKNDTVRIHGEVYRVTARKGDYLELEPLKSERGGGT